MPGMGLEIDLKTESEMEKRSRRTILTDGVILTVAT
jgi:hypothetical protein